MKFKSLAFALLIPFVAQAQEKDYFQQEVNYAIRVKLNDSLHQLMATEKIEYTNNSPDTLHFIWFHLWPNAYRDNSTALAKQLREKESNRFQFTADKNRGWIDSLNFSDGKKPLRWEYHPKHIDICKVYLNEPLLPGATTWISTPFTVKFPGDFSRLGHVGQSYQATQWYPKPAVYDRDGWHEMPYLNQGEFYSEFGSFDVKIIVPKNYRVAATGVLQNKEEINWLTELAKEETVPYPKGGFATPESETELKTLHYKQDRIHDFAWFADKRYQVKKSAVTIEDGTSVDTWVFYLGETSPAWKDAAGFLDSAIYYYSKWVGPYPYPSATAVEGPLSAGGGMEYPMVTVISSGGSAKSLDNVITHEIGHNWFYGILASNERTETWMDEGFNSYVEHRYMQKMYNEYNSINLGLPFKLAPKDTNVKLGESHFLVNFLASHNKQGDIAVHANDMTFFQYGLLAYMRTAYLLQYLEAYLGTERFDLCMHNYFDTWKFKHPSPADVQYIFEKNSGEKLDWFFQDLIRTEKQMDYGIGRVRTQGDSIRVTVHNRGGVASPYQIVFLEKGEPAKAYWVNGHEGSQSLSFPNSAYNGVVLDYYQITPDLNQRNNKSDVSGLFKRSEPLKIGFFTGVRGNERSPVFLIPSVGVNGYDRGMFGLTFHNYSLNGRKFNYIIQPLYGVGNKELVGMAHVKYDIPLPDKKIEKLRFTAQYKRFSGFEKIQPAITAFFDGRKKDHTLRSFLQLTGSRVTNLLQPDSFGVRDYNFATLRWVRKAKNHVFTRETYAGLTYLMEGNTNGFIAEIQVKETRQITKKWSVGYHAYAGMRVSDFDNAFTQLYTSSGTDFQQEYTVLDRRFTGKMGWLGTGQVLNNQGTMKHRNLFGNQVATAGIEITRKVGIPLTLYGNYGIADSLTAYEVGLGLNLGLMQVYLPIAISDNPGDGFKGWANLIRFSFKVDLFQPLNKLEFNL
ncbi:MAG: M1 family peptidase [Bacteroidetes bacterium]|nr:MAG: M1 family peptidase [Bacteroidota bacterium]